MSFEPHQEQSTENLKALILEHSQLSETSDGSLQSLQLTAPERSITEESAHVRRTLEVTEQLDMLAMRKQLTLKYQVLTAWRQLAKRNQRKHRISSPKIMQEQPARGGMISKYAHQFYQSNSVHMSVASDFHTNSSEDLEA